MQLKTSTNNLGNNTKYFDTACHKEQHTVRSKKDRRREELYVRREKRPRRKLAEKTFSVPEDTERDVVKRTLRGKRAHQRTAIRASSQRNKGSEIK